MISAAIWDAINEYAAACGGNTGRATIGSRRMDAVVAVERAIEQSLIERVKGDRNGAAENVDYDND
jgi:hypothetical protein